MFFKPLVTKRAPCTRNFLIPLTIKERQNVQTNITCLTEVLCHWYAKRVLFSQNTSQYRKTSQSKGKTLHTSCKYTLQKPHFICMTRFWSNHVENSSERGCSALDYEVQLKCLKTTDSHYYLSFILFINI